MTFEDQLRGTLDALADRVRAEVARQAEAAVEELLRSARADQASAAARAAADARTAAETAAALQVAEAREAAELRGRELGRTEGREEGRQEGIEAGRREGRQAGREEGRQEGLEAGRTDGLEAGRREGREVGRHEGLEQGLVEGRLAGTAEGRQAGFDEGRQVGRTEGWDLGRDQGFAEGQREGREAARADALVEWQAAQGIERGHLLRAIAGLDRARSLSEILDVVTASVGRDARLAGVFLVHGGRLHGWRLVENGESRRAPELVVPLDSAGVLEQAVRLNTPTASVSHAAGAAPAFMSPPDGSHLMAAPIAVGGSVVAVAYAELDTRAGSREADGAALAELDMVARHAARCLEVLTALRTSQIFSQTRGDIAGHRGGVV
jgi:hypothetical protein